MNITDLHQLKRRPVPAFPGWWAALGPGVVWMALAQGSGELIWWPYMVAKYGLTFIWLLAPACLLQYPLNLEIGRYTMLTGESIFHGFIRLHRGFGIFLWLLMSVSFLWFGAFASAGGTAMAELTHWPEGWSQRGQSLFWGYASIAVFVSAILASGVVYTLIERFMKLVALVTVIGLLSACMQTEVLASLPGFMRGLLGPSEAIPRPWEAADASKLLTAITFAGLGGFWILFYSYWLRDKGAGMAGLIGRITGLGGAEEAVHSDGFLPDEDQQSAANWSIWRKFLSADIMVGILGNLFTTLMTCLLAYALLFPKGLLPREYELAVVQSQFFAVSWGEFGRLLFLVIAAAFLTDTWLATADAVSRIQADIVMTLFPASRRLPARRWYYIFLALLTAITSFTMLLDAPGPLILTSALIGFVGTIIFPVALYILNHKLLPPHLPEWARPKRRPWLLGLSFLVYLVLAVLYLKSSLGY
ncbi:Nramp family divalent metal transporter [Methylomonas sp. SURF-2]|uniref:Nramp family divalent metal transporter n=1 Tax=Methylomonas subterranea TaxID=2952225 RepID=A0ABT1TJH7_9GAMM|nr:Nramp family divalent metal transporter [Methylomonas sp. SURF-2]MCQ8105212.1 Nramp family divalent metal transporter [Methylomonas sp. SURF-2]